MKPCFFSFLVLSLAMCSVMNAQEKGGCDLCGPSGSSMNHANGNYSATIGVNNYTNGMCSVAFGNSNRTTGGNSVAIGNFVRTNATGAVVIGSGLADSDVKALINNKQNTLMVGFNSKRPTLFVSTSAGGETTGRIGIGNVINPSAKFHLKSDANEDAGLILETSSVSTRSAYIQLYDANNKISVTKDGMNVLAGGPGLSFDSKKITLNGKVGINADNAFTGDYDYSLAVSGGILTSEVYVKEVSEWHDYVFDDSYELMPLNELNRYIDDKGCLPGVPSESTVLQKGFNLAEMDGILLKKVEELTLYVIELNEQIQRQQEIINSLQQGIK